MVQPIRPFHVLLALIPLLLAAPALAETAKKAPGKKGTAATAALKGGQKRIDAALEKMTGEGADHGAAEDQLRAAVNGFIDFKELARRALGSHWEERSEEERTRFQDTMQALVEAAYLARVSERGDYTVAYLGEDALEQGEVKVRTELRANKGSIKIDYELYRREGKWLVYDVITDDLSLLESYRSQFNQLIKKKGFEGLLSTLERKRKELEEKTAGGGGSASADG
ncbi:MAG: ABC transporter substrate-binding protein [Deltaproteobacteria bacterium]|nr:ABC transporter substrate-binding protein [Deltaproteobacteria bacterium]